jgi:hypothetical protein
MKVIIAGSRTLRVSFNFINSILIMNGIHHSDIKEIVSGKEPDGIDNCGELFAARIGVPVAPFKADWYRYGPDQVWKQAGPVRNGEMAEYVGPQGVCLLIWDGNSRGSYSMREEAIRNGLLLIEIVIRPVKKTDLKRVLGEEKYKARGLAGKGIK